MEAVIEMAPYTEVVERTIADVHRRWREYVDLDDLRSEATVWWYEYGQKYLPEYLEDEHQTRLRRSIWRFCARYAEKEKAHAVGYQPMDQVNYHPREIVPLLAVAMDPEGMLPAGARQEGPAAKGNLAEGGDVLAALIDVRRALSALPEDDIHFLTLAQDLRHDWERIATYTETLADSARRRHLRIAERMARWLNGNTEETAA